METLDIFAPKTVLPARKREPTVKEGRSTTHHTLATLKGVSLYVSGKDRFRYVPPQDDKPAHFYGYVGGLVKVHAYEGVDTKFDGKQRVDIEVCAIIVRNAETGMITDAHVYLNVRQATEPGEGPTQVLSIHGVSRDGVPEAPKATTIAYIARKGAVAVQSAADFVASQQRKERPTLAQPLGAHLVAALKKDGARDSSNLSVAERRDAVSLGGAKVDRERRRC